MKFRFTTKTLLTAASLGVIVCNLIAPYTTFLPLLWTLCFIEGICKIQGTFEAMSTIQLWMTPKRDFTVSIRPTTGIKPLYTTIATVTMNLIVSAAIVLLNPYVTVYISYKIPPFALSVHIPDVSTSIYVEVDSKVLLGLPFCDKASGRLHHSGTPLGLHRVPYR